MNERTATSDPLISDPRQTYRCQDVELLLSAEILHEKRPALPSHDSVIAPTTHDLGGHQTRDRICAGDCRNCDSTRQLPVRFHSAVPPEEWHGRSFSPRDVEQRRSMPDSTVMPTAQVLRGQPGRGLNPCRRLQEL
jgi:hypothetical protein